MRNNSDCRGLKNEIDQTSGEIRGLELDKKEMEGNLSSTREYIDIAEEKIRNAPDSDAEKEARKELSELRSREKTTLREINSAESAIQRLEKDLERITNNYTLQCGNVA